MTAGHRISGTPCPICDNESTMTPEDGEYIRCHRCGVLRTRYDYNGAMYNNNYAKTYVDYANGPFNTPLNLFRLGLVSRWLRPKEKLLDIGCCIGEFIRFAERYYECEGFEPNKTAANLARYRAFSPILNHLNGAGPAKAITMFDVLEHIQNPRDFIATLVNKYLVPGGVVALTTPNVEAVPLWNDNKMRTWKHYKPTEHLYLYSEHSLTILFNQVGLEPVHWGAEESDIRPGNPDRDILTCVARKPL